MKKLFNVFVLCIFTIAIISCGSDQSTKDKLEVMAEVMEAMNNAYETNNAVAPDSNPNLEGFIEIDSGFTVTYSGSITYNDDGSMDIDLNITSTMENYESGGYTLNGGLTETYDCSMSADGSFTIVLTYNGTVDFSGEENGTFSFNKFKFTLSYDATTGLANISYNSGTVTFDGENVTDDLILAFEAVQ